MHRRLQRHRNRKSRNRRACLLGEAGAAGEEVTQAERLLCLKTRTSTQKREVNHAEEIEVDEEGPRLHNGDEGSGWGPVGANLEVS
jgi:hypothetical protein